MRRRVGGLGVDERACSRSAASRKRGMSAGVVLPVLVHRHDPVAARGGHAGQRGGVLAEVPAQPNRSHERRTRGRASDNLSGVVRPMIVDEQ